MPTKLTSEDSKLMANAIRALSMDAVQKANSGHPGMPMGMADIAVALWHDHLKHNPKNPLWMDRDRFVLSNGHGSMLLYSVLHLTGYDLPMSEIENFRQLHSKTAGHPEYRVTPGVETTTGPLGQGISNAVGMALAEKLLAEEFNRPGHAIINHFTYAFLGDGCLMEGISHEACSLAGTLGLSKLIAVWDDNGISIDGRVVNWFAEDTPKRFEAYGWNVIRDINGHDAQEVSSAMAYAKSMNNGKPTLIACKTRIGEGSPNLADTDKVHGAPLGATEIAATRESIGWNYPPFTVPPEVYGLWDAKEMGAATEQLWNLDFKEYQKEHPDLAKELLRRMSGDLPESFEATVQSLLVSTSTKAETIATRKASQNAIDRLAQVLPEFLGGSADLTGSNLTNWSNSRALQPNTWGNHISYGVREFGMSAIMNGVSLHGGYIPFGGTFLTFSDYSRNALRMAALMKIRSIFVFTHDSIGLGEDGPTHQAVEQTASLRLIPNMDVWRPADTTESAVAWASAVKRRKGPTSLIFSRQNCPYLEKTAEQIANIEKGAYVLKSVKNPQVVFIATGSEVGLAISAAAALAEQGIAANVVSMPSTTTFDQQSSAYKASVLPLGIPRIAIEAGVTDGWWKYGCAAVQGLDTFGESAPATVLYQYFGLTTENIVKTTMDVIGQTAS
jgi:transketolase